MKSKYFREYFCNFSSKSYYFYILGVSHLKKYYDICKYICRIKRNMEMGKPVYTLYHQESFCIWAKPMRVFVTLSLIGWSHTKNDPCILGLPNYSPHMQCICNVYVNSDKAAMATVWWLFICVSGYGGLGWEVAVLTKVVVDNLEQFTGNPGLPDNGRVRGGAMAECYSIEVVFNKSIIVICTISINTANFFKITSNKCNMVYFVNPDFRVRSMVVLSLYMYKKNC